MRDLPSESSLKGLIAIPWWPSFVRSSSSYASDVAKFSYHHHHHHHLHGFVLNFIANVVSFRFMCFETFAKHGHAPKHRTRPTVCITDEWWDNLKCTIQDKLIVQPSGCTIPNSLTCTILDELKYEWSEQFKIVLFSAFPLFSFITNLFFITSILSNIISQILYKPSLSLPQTNLQTKINSSPRNLERRESHIHHLLLHPSCEKKFANASESWTFESTVLSRSLGFFRNFMYVLRRISPTSLRQNRF